MGVNKGYVYRFLKRNRGDLHMELKEVLGARRTIRYYLPFKPVEREKVEKMLEGARRASCVGNVNNTKAIVIWRDQASDELMKVITPMLGYQQMQTAPCFILWYNDTDAYSIDHWMKTLKGLREMGRTGTGDPAFEGVATEEAVRPIFERIWKDAAVNPLAFMDVGQAICQATLVAYDEGLSTCCMSSPAIEGMGPLLKLPESAIPVCIQSIGYSAETPEAGGQTVKEPFENLFSEMEHGTPFPLSPEVEEELKQAKMIQRPAPLPWRQEEFKYLWRALQLEVVGQTPPDGKSEDK
jgi:nitroreductase